MKITVSQLRRIIREEVEKNLTESNAMPLKDGGVVNSETGEILDMDSVPPQYLDYVEIDEMGYTTLSSDKFDELRGELIPDSLDVHDEFMMWVDRNGEVPIEKLAAELGVEPEQIDWNGTGLRVIDGVVTELLSDTPYRTSR